MDELENLGVLVHWVVVAQLRSRTVHQARGRKLGGRGPKRRYCWRSDGGFFFSGNRVLKESRDSQGQGSGHVGVPTFVEALQCGVGKSA
jgi:hypothetical protein